MIPTISHSSSPKLPSSYFWTWDHSTNWVLDDPGLQIDGCINPYFKQPETFVEDYRRLTDLSANLGVRGIFIWGFLRDAHGGEQAAKRVAGYGRSRGVDILPGFGTTCYGGAYYEGSHRYNLSSFVASNPKAAMIDSTGKVEPRGACASDESFLHWMKESARWLFDNFEIGGLNIENGDFYVCCEERCKTRMDAMGIDDPRFFKYQSLTYIPLIESLSDLPDYIEFPWATYCGFLPGKGQHADSMPYMQCQRPAIIDLLPENILCQWTLSGMVFAKPLPLSTYLEDGTPAAAFNNPNWPEGLRPPSKRSIGFSHRPSQWSLGGRYSLGISAIKEACLRSYHSGLEGVVIHGEVSARCIPWALNYLAFSHFIHFPQDSLKDFGRKTLGQLFDDEGDGELYVVLLAKVDAATVTESDATRLREMASRYWCKTDTPDSLYRYHFWGWLQSRIDRPDLYPAGLAL